VANYFTSVVLQVNLGSWTDISTDWLVNESASMEWGISGSGPLDLMPDIGEMQFVLNNSTGKYYPDGATPLSGWGYGVPVRMIFTALSQTRTLLYYVSKIELLAAGDIETKDRVKVTALDWIKFAESYPILEPDIEENKRADEGIQTIITSMSNPPASYTLQTGINTFPVIFDGVKLRTTAYTEFSKFVYSEFGAMALLKDATNGEQLKFFNYAANTGGAISAALSTEIDGLSLVYGDNIINRGIVTAYPKKIDIEPRVLYSLDKPMPIYGNEQIDFRAHYTDPDGGATVNAIGSSMLAPEVPGAVDPYLMTLLNFTDDLTDETGRHTWVTDDDLNAMLQNDVYADAYATKIPGNMLGPYIIFGGYPSYNLRCPTSADFEFGAGAFTIGWYQNTINPDTGNTTMARDNTSLPPFLLGYPMGSKEMTCWFASGTGGSWWDIGSQRSMGQIQRGRWTYYEISRDEDGWFYCFADGRLTDKWYSPLAIAASSGDWTIGNTLVNDWAWIGFDSFFIKKGQCLHKKDFERPLRNIKPTLDGDYLLNTLEDGTGTDVSADLIVGPTYGSEAITYSLYDFPVTPAGKYNKNWITHLQARGRGVYAYNSIENSVTDTDAARIKKYGYREINLDQKYQTDVKFGTGIIAKIVSQEKTPRTQVTAVSFLANLNTTTMNNFLKRDIHDLIHITDAARGVNNFFFIQKIKFTLQSYELVKVTWQLKSALDVDASVGTGGGGGGGTLDPGFGGIVNVGVGSSTGDSVTQAQTIEFVTLTQDHINAVDITVSDLMQAQTIDAVVIDFNFGTLLPAGIEGSVQYNDGGILGGDANLVWDKTAQVLTILGTITAEGLPATAGSDAGGYQASLEAGAGDGTGTGGNGELIAGDGGATGDGGKIILRAGDAGATSGNGGKITIQSGNSFTSGNGGDIELTPGPGAGAGVDGIVSISGSDLHILGTGATGIVLYDTTLAGYYRITLDNGVLIITAV